MFVGICSLDFLSNPIENLVQKSRARDPKKFKMINPSLYFSKIIKKDFFWAKKLTTLKISSKKKIFFFKIFQ